MSINKANDNKTISANTIQSTMTDQKRANGMCRKGNKKHSWEKQQKANMEGKSSHRDKVTEPLE